MRSPTILSAFLSQPCENVAIAINSTRVIYTSIDPIMDIKAELKAASKKRKEIEDQIAACAARLETAGVGMHGPILDDEVCISTIVSISTSSKPQAYYNSSPSSPDHKHHRAFQEET